MIRLISWASCALLVLAIGSAAAYRAYAQSRGAAQLAIHTSSGIEESAYDTLGGVPQWVQIRGEDRENPVVIVLHGGPGMSYVPFTTVFRPWEKHFTVVQWDRRGVGRTYRKSGATGAEAITFDRLADDGIELAEHLRDRLHKDRVFLIGHSVGSIVGTLMALKRPDLFYAYIGTDQIVDGRANERVSYDMLVDRVRAGDDSKAKESVAKLGPPPYTRVDDWFEKQRLISATDPIAPGAENVLFRMAATAPGFTMADMMALGAGLKFSASALLNEMMTIDLRSRATNFGTPVLLVEGEKDVLDPTPLAIDWFHTIKAPAKDLVVLPGVGHGAMLSHADLFLSELLKLRERMLPHRTE